MLPNCASCLLGCLLALPAAAQPLTLTLCHEDTESYPWLLNDGNGLNQSMMRMVGRKLGIVIDTKPMPWLRCMHEVQDGRIDGLYKIRFTPERLQLGAFPMQDGQPDPALRMMTDSYSLYRLKGSNLRWDGRIISHADKGIAAQAGFAVVDQLQQMGLHVDNSSRSATAILYKLLLGRTDGAALQTGEADHALSSDPALRAGLEKLEPPLQITPYYLIFSHRFFQQHPDTVRLIWQTVATVRSSPEYRALRIDGQIPVTP
ncbi:substrate-binding periplasmic protein [Chromobacterium sp. CV08]|uniref:substrate-binding periplasmic protein n=1 Tax=Chromobacterium sp. CV08 TaxID=3133274 RepID=UPI003DA9E076